MKGTSIFQFKSWPKIHQPLPRTPRESQQLLNALTSSFRRQLDRAYPASDPTTHEGDRQPLNTDSSHHATEQHLHNILDNPLFRIVPQKAASPQHHVGRSIGEQKRMAEEPMQVFDELVASGSVTLTAITNCLKYQQLLIRSTDEGVTIEAMKNSRAASRVVEWFWASDGAARQMLLHSRTTTSSLTKFMVTEDLQGTILQWLKMLIHRDLGGQNGEVTEIVAQQSFSNILVDFLDAEIRYGNGLTSAFKSYLQICHYYSMAQPTPNLPRKSMLLAAGAHLSRAAMDSKPLAELVSAYTYEEYRDVMSTLSSPRSLLFSSVSLCHPERPDAKPFTRFVETLSPAKVHGWNNARRDALLRIACDALHLLIEQQKIREATTLARQVQQLLPEQAMDDSKASSVTTAHRETEDLLNRLELSLT